MYDFKYSKTVFLGSYNLSYVFSCSRVNIFCHHTSTVACTQEKQHALLCVYIKRIFTDHECGSNVVFGGPPSSLGKSGCVAGSVRARISQEILLHYLRLSRLKNRLIQAMPL